MANSSTVVSSSSFKYDFVVFYADTDREEAYRIAEFLEEEQNGKFKGFLDDRNGFAGGTDVGNLDFALNNCKAYIILISEDFLECKFREFAMQTSLHESFNNPCVENRLLPLSMNIREDQIPKTLKIIQDVPYEPSSDIFWDKLKKSVRFICKG